jgi:hypothetical protein
MTLYQVAKQFRAVGKHRRAAALGTTEPSSLSFKYISVSFQQQELFTMYAGGSR